MARHSILVVEDDEDYRGILKRILEPAGYKTLVAGSAEEALEILKIRGVDAAVVDWNLPGASGVELCKRVRKDPALARTVLVMLTVRDEPQDQVRALQKSGANLYLIKPVAPKELLARLQRLIQTRDGS